MDHSIERELPELSHSTDGVADRQEFLEAVRDLLRIMLPSDAVSWNARDPATGTAEVFGYESERNAFAAAMLADVEDHPMVLSYLRSAASGDLSPRRLSDVVTRRELRRTRAYVDLMRPFDAEHQLTILTMRIGQHGGGTWSFTRRTRDFTEDERDQAAMLQPALVTIERCWAARAARQPLRPDDDFGLTPRQVEILGLVARGLTATAIAHALRISPRTVGKHLQSAYEKLGRHDRLGAVERLRAAGVLPPAVDLGGSPVR